MRRPLTSSERLAGELAELAQALRDRLATALERGEAPARLAEFAGIDDPNALADGYAQALAYGLFAARWSTRRREPEFCRPRLRALLPTTGGAALERFEALLAAKLGPESDALIDAIVELLAATELEQLFAESSDPAIHFYQDFLARYDPRLRRAWGVWSTPTPLARYVVAGVDAGLRAGLGLRLGLADASVEIIDPAVGTGEFLVRVIERVHATMSAEYAAAGYAPEAAAEAWRSYVRERLLPRLRGVELGLAPLLVCELRLALALHETGFVFEPGDALRLTLADALASPLRSAGTANYAVVLGNPPYGRAPAGHGEFVEQLVAPYKQAVRGERNIQPLSDDYIAFCALAEDCVAGAEAGIFALVVNGTCLAGLLHRGLRTRLRERFDRLALTDLHGSQKVALREGLGATAVDENLFDIQQGVAVIHAERHPSRAAAATIVHRELIGARANKLAWLRERARSSDPFAEHRPIPASAPLCLFTSAGPIPAEYAEFVALPELFEFHSVAGKPGKDALLVDFDAAALIPKLEARRAELAAGAVARPTEAERKLAQRPLARPFEPARIRPYAYRPGDTRWTYYEAEIWTRAVTALAARLDGAPVLLTSRIVKDPSFAHVWVTRELPDVICLSATSSVNCHAFISTKHFMNFELSGQARFDYIYAVLHSPEYRRRYADALRHDFARIPMPGSSALVFALVELGARLRAAHLLEQRVALAPEIARFVDGGDRRVLRAGEPRRRLAPSGAPGFGTLWINDRSRFERIPESAYSLRIGGYLLLHKWQSDRKKAGRSLSDADLDHYRALVGLCLRTRECMVEIDAAISRCGGWPGAFRRTGSGAARPR